MNKEDRIPFILSQVRRIIIDEGGRFEGNEDYRSLVYKVQLDISDRAWVIKRRVPLTLRVGVASYPLDETLFRIASVSTPEYWVGDFSAVHTPQDWSVIESQKITSAQPTKCFLWNGEFLLKPAPTKADQIILYAYAHSGEVEFDGTTWGELEIAEDCDEALQLGIIERLSQQQNIGEKMKTPNAEWKARYEAAIQFLKGKNQNEFFGPIKVYSTVSDIGF